jgi:hypothetical protein
MQMQRPPKRPPKGSRVLLKKPHPWHGHVGTVENHATWMGQAAFGVRLENGHRAGVLVSHNYDILEPKP